MKYTVKPTTKFQRDFEIMMIISISRAALATSKNQSVARTVVYLNYYVNLFWRIFTKI